MTVVRTRNIVHVDDVHRITIQGRIRLEDTTIAHAASFVLAHPAVLDGSLTSFEDARTDVSIKGKPLIQLLLEIFIQRPLADEIGDFFDEAMESVDVAHEMLPLYFV